VNYGQNKHLKKAMQSRATQQSSDWSWPWRIASTDIQTHIYFD